MSVNGHALCMYLAQNLPLCYCTHSLKIFPSYPDSDKTDAIDAKLRHGCH